MGSLTNRERAGWNIDAATRVGSDVTLVCWGDSQWARALSHSQRARGDKAVDFAFAQTELAKHCVVVFALEGAVRGVVGIEGGVVSG